MEENYKLRLKDWLPIKGFIDYTKRNEPNEKCIPRAQALHWYNKGLCIVGAIGTLVIGLEKILE